MKATRIGQCAAKNGSATGKGTYSSVYKGRLEAKGEGAINVAVKEYMLPIQKDDPEAASMVEGALSILLEDMEKDLITLPPHPHLCRYYGIEFIPGMVSGNLDRVLLTVDWVEHSKKLKGPLPEGEVKEIARGILKALAHLHENGLSHDDLRPVNILTTTSWTRKDPNYTPPEGTPTAVLTDYNIFKKIQDILDPMGGGATTKQKPNYCAPEVFTDGKDYDAAKCDVWSLAACMVELLSGKIPFHEMDPSGRGNVMFKIIQSRNPPNYPSTISADCKAFLDACFNRDYNSRPSAQEALQLAWFQ